MSSESMPLTRKGRATRERILEAASALMFERGVAGTSVDDVKREAGVSSSQLYHYFADKQALVRAVVAYQTDLVLAANEPLLARLDSLEALRAWRDFVVEVQTAADFFGGCPMGSLASELADSDPQAREQLALGFARWETMIRDGLRAMRDRGELRAEADPDRLALALLTALQGGLLLSQTRREVTPLQVSLDTMLEHITSLRVPSPSGT
ncbi:MAG TPA: TetR/AcrR family transcriptional regulator [Solirubrobacteraceae bacterium]|jgi:AcrR family transcriptional regulator|nr:TetR/AcrR family transcriptional regulator [Solirubrobacteraceae bacterium]